MLSDPRQVILDALDDAVAVRNNPDANDCLRRTGDLDLRTLGLDSLTIMETLMVIEDKLDIELDADILDDHPMLNDLARAIAADHAIEA